MAKITKVKLDKLFSTSSYLNDRVGVEAELSQGEDPIQALMELTNVAIEFNKREYPELYLFNDKPMTASEVDSVVGMNQCETLPQLSKYKRSLTVTTKKYYDDRVIELSSKPSYVKADMP